MSEERSMSGKVIGKTGYVYLMWNMRLFKIGVSQDPMTRRRQIESASGDNVFLIAAMKCDNMFQMEDELHTIFADRRKKGEWFDLTDDEVADIINTLGGLHVFTVRYLGLDGVAS